MKKMKTVVAIVLLAGILFETRGMDSLAAEIPQTAVMYKESGGGAMKYCTSPDEAFRNCYQPGGRIYFKKSCDLELGGTMSYNRPRSNIEIIVEEGATLTIGKKGVCLDGAYLTINGTLDLNASEGELMGKTSYINMGEKGRYIKKRYDFEKKEAACFTAKDIYYGQPLSDADILPDNVHWKNSVEGSWSFTQPEHIPEAGKRQYDVIFTPRHDLTYDPLFCPSGGLATVRQTVPRLAEYQTPSIYVGQELRGAEPAYTFTSPVTGEEIKGRLVFEEEGRVFYQAKEQSVTAVFTPENSNYAVTKQAVKVKVISVTPEMKMNPAPRKNGEVGQSLQDIPILDGVCVNPHTGERIEGSWEWKDKTAKIKKGKTAYPVLFLPKESGYQRLEMMLYVTGEEKKAETVKKADSGEELPIIITQMVSRLSDIQKPKAAAPSKTKIKKIKRTGKKAKISCRKVKKAGYEVQYAANKKWKKAKKKYCANPVVVIKKLRNKKKYYFRARTWDKKRTVHSKWSDVKKG